MFVIFTIISSKLWPPYLCSEAGHGPNKTRSLENSFSTTLSVCSSQSGTLALPDCEAQSNHQPSTRLGFAGRSESCSEMLTSQKADRVFGVLALFAFRVSMPEAAVYEDHFTFPRENKIWSAGQVPTMQAKAISESMYNRTDGNLRCRVLRLNLPHQGRSGGTGGNQLVCIPMMLAGSFVLYSHSKSDALLAMWPRQHTNLKNT